MTGRAGDEQGGMMDWTGWQERSMKGRVVL